MPHRRVVPAAAVAAGFALLAPALAATLPAVPDKLKAPADQTLALDLRASGVQIYVCSAHKDDATKFEWTLKAPEAELSDAAGKKVVKHYGGPTWEAVDGSKVVGELKARDDGPDPNAIPWLLLSAKTVSGNGMSEPHREHSAAAHRRRQGPCERLQPGGASGRPKSACPTRRTTFSTRPSHSELIFPHARKLPCLPT